MLIAVDRHPKWAWTAVGLVPVRPTQVVNDLL